MKMTTKEIMESKSLLEDGRESINIYRQMLRDQCEGDINVSLDILEETLTPVILDAADKAAIDQVDNFEDENKIEQAKVEADVMTRDGFSFRSLYNDAVKNPDDIDNYSEEIEAELKDIFKNLVTIVLGERNLRILDKETEDNISKRLKYFSSPEYDKMLEKRRDNYEERLKLEDIKPELRKELEHKIAMINDRYSLSFMMKVFGKTDTSKQQAIDRLRNNFFDSKKSEYTMKRFFDRCHRYNIERYSYKKAIDLEEKYLPEKYHVFNNFFLFILVSHIAYIYEENGGIEAYLILGNVEKLTSNSFPTKEARQLFLDGIMRMLDIFEHYAEEFKKRNQLCSKHPIRIQKEAEREKEIRNMLYMRIKGDQLTEGGVITPEIEAMSVKELLSFCSARTNQKEYWKHRFIKEERINTLYDMVFAPYHLYKDEKKSYYFEQFGTVDDEEKKDYIIGLWFDLQPISGVGVVAYDWRNKDIRFVGTFNTSTPKEITTKIKEIMDKLPKAVFVIGRGLNTIGDTIIDNFHKTDYMKRIFYTQREESSFKHFGVMINQAVYDLMFKAFDLVTALRPELFRSGKLVDEISNLRIKEGTNHVELGTVHSRVCAFSIVLYAVIFLPEFDRYGIEVNGKDFGNIREETLKTFSSKRLPIEEDVIGGVGCENPIKSEKSEKVISQHGCPNPDLKEKYEKPIIARGMTTPFYLKLEGDDNNE